MSWPWKIGLWTCIPTLYLFYKAFFLRALHKFSPPQAFIGLKDVSHVNLTLHSIDKRYLQICATVSLQDLPNNLRRPKFKELPHRFTKIPFPLQLHMRKISSFFERYILCMWGGGLACLNSAIFPFCHYQSQYLRDTAEMTYLKNINF